MKEQAFLILKENIIKPEHMELTTIAEITAHLQQREGLFLNRLATITGKSRYTPKLSRRTKVGTDKEYSGWEKITYDPESKKHIVDVFNSETHIPGDRFTGNGECFLSSWALYDGLTSTVSSNIEVSVMLITAFFNKESPRGGVGFYRKHRGGHGIVKVHDTNTNETIYVDGTYGQVRAEEAGKIHIIPPELLGIHYQTTDDGEHVAYATKRALEEKDIVPVPTDRLSSLRHVLDTFNVQNRRYQTLVRTIDPTGNPILPA